MTLHDRCKAFLDHQAMQGILRVGSRVEDLMAFVVAETGRTGDKSLDETLPLCLYFGTKADREEFIAAVREWKPAMITKEMP